MKVVIDCNIFISAGLNRGTCRDLIYELIEHHTVYFSPEIIEEYTVVINRPKFQKVPAFNLILQDLGTVAIIVKPAQHSFKLADPNDETYLSTALTAKADVVITGNKKHFPLNEYEGVKIISPREFLDLL
ncbi:MAG: putative toxin-antitoxin system toxin component, PIN family [Nitrospirae bacterium]|nr:putative toxin-antitoxin system toxin component, PIN family [Nitrospirota bacterium]